MLTVHFVVDNWQPMLLLKVAKFTMLYSDRYNENNIIIGKMAATL